MMLSPTLVFCIKLFFLILLACVWGYLTLYPQPHSDVIITMILPILGGLVHNMMTTLNVTPVTPVALTIPAPVVTPVTPVALTIPAPVVTPALKPVLPPQPVAQPAAPAASQT